MCALKVDVCHCVHLTSNVKKMVAWKSQVTGQHRLCDKKVKSNVYFLLGTVTETEGTEKPRRVLSLKKAPLSGQGQASLRSQVDAPPIPCCPKWAIVIDS